MNTSARPHDPRPVVPRHGQVIDGAHVILRWEHPEASQPLRVQIAEDASFDDLVLDEDVPAGSEQLVVQRHFPEEGRTFYWRVVAKDADGWSPGEHIESFASGRADDVALSSDPDAEEPLGPLPELFRVAELQAMAELTPGRQPAAERALGGKPEGLEGAEIVTIGFTFVIAAGVFLVVVVAILFYAC